MEELKLNRVLLLLFLSLTIITSCDFFNTRDPESPNSSDSQFLPQTSADYVISNFIKSFTEKNIDKYMSTFVDKSMFANFNYEFFPSVESLIQFPNTFDNWNRDSENLFIQSLKSKMSKSKNLKLVFSNSKTDFNSDSSTFTYDYYCELDTLINTIPNKYSGIIQLVVVKNQNGQWAISKWYDFKKNNDTIQNTFSVLKANFSN